MARDNDLSCATSSGNYEVIGGMFYVSLPSPAIMLAGNMLTMYKRKRSRSECMALFQSEKSHAGW